MSNIYNHPDLVINAPYRLMNQDTLNKISSKRRIQLIYRGYKQEGNITLASILEQDGLRNTH